MHQNEDAHASVHLGTWKLVAHGDFFPEQPARHRRSNSTTSRRIRPRTPISPPATRIASPTCIAACASFGTWQQPGVGAYAEGRAGFTAPKDWEIRN
jgi:hypothetical protein